MEIGKLNRRITITTYAASSETPSGGTTKGASSTSDTWCSAKPLAQKESVLYGLKIGQRGYKFGFRYEAGVDIGQTNELTYESRRFRVIQVLEIDEAKRMIIVIANERTN